MILLNVIAYLSDAWVLTTYTGLSLGRLHARAFHWANAIGCVPLLALEVITGAWFILPLTLWFGVAGWIGVWRTR